MYILDIVPADERRIKLERRSGCFGTFFPAIENAKLGFTLTV
jgi:hypothetical protein